MLLIAHQLGHSADVVTTAVTVTLPTVIRRGAVTEGSLARYTTVTSQAIRRTAEDNDVIRRT